MPRCVVPIGVMVSNKASITTTNYDNEYDRTLLSVQLIVRAFKPKKIGGGCDTQPPPVYKTFIPLLKNKVGVATL